MYNKSKGITLFVKKQINKKSNKKINLAISITKTHITLEVKKIPIYNLLFGKCIVIIKHMLKLHLL